ncbi:MAG: hypothetical protein E7551_08530 [Ruminococcaceae bacterium]|nr:hypothetical protein [Oscillospiraceae bacterium]
MSILNGNISLDVTFPISMPFGAQMEEITCIPELSLTAAALDKQTLICGGQGVISLHNIGKNGNSKEISSLKIFGNARQIGVYNGFAYVSTRESGVSVCDLTNPQNPILAYQIDSLELATGIAVANGVLAITNRHMGCELYDVRDPYHPRRLNDFQCGEAQSVYLYENLAIVSHWMGREAAIFDISNPMDIQRISSFSVDGFADGVCVIKHDERLICLVGTGHHATRLKNRRKYKDFAFVTAEMIAEGYGGGHGVEIFDITNPSMPEWLSTLKTPPLFGGLDTWLVYSDGESCVFTDSMNGIFTISLDDITNPQFTGYYKLKPLAYQKVTSPSVQVQTASITGAASVNGFLCAASNDDGVHILKPNHHINGFLSPKATIDFDVEPTNSSAFYSSLGQIHNFVEYNGRVYCASGELGVEVIDLNGNLLYVNATSGICHDVCLHEGRLYTAEGDMGVACYDVTETLTEHSRITDIGCVRQIVEAGAGLVIQIGYIKISKLTAIDGKLVLSDGDAIASMLYHRHLSRTQAGSYTVAMPSSQGALILETNEGVQKVASLGIQSCSFADGACGYKDKLIALFRGKYLCLDDPKDISKPFNGNDIEGALLSGIPYVLGDTLVILNRCTGVIELLDISDEYNPKFIKRIKTSGYPEACSVINEEIYVAMGFGGILKI